MKKLAVIISSVILTAAAALMLAGCGQGSDFKRITEKGTLVVGVTVYDPMDYLNEDNEWVGFDAEVAQKMADEWGVKAQFVIIKWDNKVAELNSRAIDVIWNGMTADEELGQKIDFSVSYAENKQVAVVKKSKLESFDTAEKIAAAKLAVEKGSAGDTVATQTLNADSINRVDAQVNALVEVKAGTSDVAVIDYTMAYSVIGKGEYSDLVIVNPDTVSFEREVFAVGLRKGSDLTEKINALFKKYYNDGTLGALAQKYVSVALNEQALGAL